MRRLPAIAIALLLSFTLAAPLFAIGTSTSLPECCRRNGMHHCMGQMMPDSNQSFVAVTPRCPRFPTASPAPQPYSLIRNKALGTDTPVFVHPASLPQTEARYRVSFSRSRQKRGPPIILL